ncbi:hypothetical protein PVAP13_2KG207700 [Panicum virgatum]|uniref:Uncharacterized protein n=1 Tax=Panicum virgatum TaxID=38727 RepID=A0A8T0W099_PANVG|nr:hypothetical protein PVAP13_2KG207700 [Panicum virgatum]
MWSWSDRGWCTDSPARGRPPRTAASSSVTVVSPQGKTKVLVSEDQKGTSWSSAPSPPRRTRYVVARLPSRIPSSRHRGSCSTRSLATHRPQRSRGSAAGQPSKLARTPPSRTRSGLLGWGGRSGRRAPPLVRGSRKRGGRPTEAVVDPRDRVALPSSLALRCAACCGLGLWGMGTTSPWPWRRPADNERAACTGGAG